MVKHPPTDPFLTTESIERYQSAHDHIPGPVLFTAAQLFSNNYGVWSHNQPDPPNATDEACLPESALTLPGKRVLMSPWGLRRKCLPSRAESHARWGVRKPERQERGGLPKSEVLGSTFVRVVIDGEVAGHACAVRWVYEEGVADGAPSSSALGLSRMREPLASNPSSAKPYPWSSPPPASFYQQPNLADRQGQSQAHWGYGEGARYLQPTGYPSGLRSAPHALPQGSHYGSSTLQRQPQPRPPRVSHQVCWISQLVVEERFRERGVATRLLSAVKEAEDKVFGICSSHPAALKAAGRAWSATSSWTRPQESQFAFMKKHARDLVKTAPIDYVRRAKVRGTLFDDDSDTSSLAHLDTRFYVDHREPDRALERVRAQGKEWPFGGLPEGSAETLSAQYSIPERKFQSDSRKLRGAPVSDSESRESVFHVTPRAAAEHTANLQKRPLTQPVKGFGVNSLFLQTISSKQSISSTSRHNQQSTQDELKTLESTPTSQTPNLTTTNKLLKKRTTVARIPLWPSSIVGLSGVPEVRSGFPTTPPSPPAESPPLLAVHATNDTLEKNSSGGYFNNSNRKDGRNNRLVGAARTITEECERLFCGTLRAYFLGEKETSLRDPLVVGASFDSNSDYSDDLELYYQQRYGHGHRQRGMEGCEHGPVMAGLDSGGMSDTSDIRGTCRSRNPDVKEYIELWDYMGGALFRGFTVYDAITDSKTLFTFFDDMVIGRDLKKGLMALIELASTPPLSCTSLIIAIDKTLNNQQFPTKTSTLVRDLGWVGFEATTLEAWGPSAEEKWGELLPTTSERWLLLGMEV
ncbi:MAG: hypothetical protein M1831_001137 [Alyxoria varia]|nr:MAG: hypothetical protein M1831_001137 [Alyxoria varia]